MSAQQSRWLTQEYAAKYPITMEDDSDWEITGRGDLAGAEALVRFVNGRLEKAGCKIRGYVAVRDVFATEWSKHTGAEPENTMALEDYVFDALFPAADKIAGLSLDDDETLEYYAGIVKLVAHALQARA